MYVCKEYFVSLQTLGLKYTIGLWIWRMLFFITLLFMIKFIDLPKYQVIADESKARAVVSPFVHFL